MSYTKVCPSSFSNTTDKTQEIDVRQHLKQKTVSKEYKKPPRNKVPNVAETEIFVNPFTQIY